LVTRRCVLADHTPDGTALMVPEDCSPEARFNARPGCCANSWCPVNTDTTEVKPS
jgi:hypothetical protein